MEIVGWKKKEKIEADLIIIDEASMVDFSIWRDLCSYGVPIIAVGDHGQLPPIEGNFNLMEKPDFKLEEIHRQAKDNPIIKLSILARKNGQIPIGNYGRNVKKTCREDPDSQELVNDLLQDYKDQTLVLCGYNLTRVKLNKYIREALGFETNSPGKGDRVICLRNNHAKKICNGMLGKISSIEDLDGYFYKTEIEMDGEERPYEGLILKDQFNRTQALNFTKERYLTIKSDLFDFGYALTVHKAQGSQAKRVILFEERFSKMDDEMWRRWLYTGVTRAEEELFIIG
jgi:exodeoxyribonuclease-5